MRKILVICAAMLTGCGGGSGEDAVSANASSYAPTQNICGVEAGDKMVVGVVIEVHDGDTITVLSADNKATKVRMEGIDAPELAQPFGANARDILSAATLGRAVRVAFSKTDQYGRTVGAVFTESCRYVNLDMVTQGSAWYYKAYQCELGASTRTLFAAAQAGASQSGIGLWVQAEPEAPWYFRNGSEPPVPSCSGGSPSYAASTALTLPAVALPTAPAVTSSTSPTSTSSPTCYVGPRGGTYTITSSGKKNYGGC